MDAENIRHLAKLLGSPALGGRSGNIRIRCPMAPLRHKSGTDRTPDLSVKIDPGPSVCFCFACGVAGMLLDIFSNANDGLGGMYQAAVEFIAHAERSRLGGLIAKLKRSRPGAEEKRAAPFNLHRYIAECSRQVPPYLIDRGLGDADFQKWRIGVDQEMGRAVFPIWDIDGKLMGASRRALHGQEPKYFDTPGLPKDKLFYGEHLVDHTIGRVHLVEGVLDTIFAARVLPNALGVLGANTRLSPERMAKLRNWCKSVVLLFDSDQAGRRAVYGFVDDYGKPQPGLATILRPYFPVLIAWLPEGQDPASVPGSELLKAVENSSYIFR